MALPEESLFFSSSSCAFEACYLSRARVRINNFIYIHMNSD